MSAYINQNSYKEVKKMSKKISIKGMSCSHCVHHVTEALNEIDGVSSVKVSLADKNAVIETSKEVSDEVIKAAIDDVGFEVVAIK